MGVRIPAVVRFQTIVSMVVAIVSMVGAIVSMDNGRRNGRANSDNILQKSSKSEVTTNRKSAVNELLLLRSPDDQW